MRNVTKEKVLEAIRILAGQCGNAKIRNENKKIILAYVKEREEDDNATA